MSNSRKLTLVTLLGMFLLVGCNRAFYRQQADQDVACMVAEKSNDPRWALSNFNINMDPRSRYYDPYDPDAPPMPPDDPGLHQFMHCVDGKKGWSKWHQNGVRPDLENPGWRERLYEYAPINENGEIVLTLDSALQIAFINSPNYQETVETLYLSALDVTTERFRFDTQFFGGTGAGSRGNTMLNVTSSDTRLRLPSNARVQRNFATAGELVVDFVNEFMWTFGGPNPSSAFSALSFSFVQPLLRGAGRDIALEQLTIVERALLANLRAFHAVAKQVEHFFANVVQF